MSNLLASHDDPIPQSLETRSSGCIDRLAERCGNRRLGLIDVTTTIRSIAPKHSLREIGSFQDDGRVRSGEPDTTD